MLIYFPSFQFGLHIFCNVTMTQKDVWKYYLNGMGYIISTYSCFSGVLSLIWILLKLNTRNRQLLQAQRAKKSSPVIDAPADSHIHAGKNEI